MQCFLDDERIAAKAIEKHYFLTAEIVYKNLLDGHTERYLDMLERITERECCKELKEWCIDTLKKLNESRCPLWSLDDFDNLEKGFR